MPLGTKLFLVYLFKETGLSSSLFLCGKILLQSCLLRKKPQRNKQRKTNQQYSDEECATAQDEELANCKHLVARINLLYILCGLCHASLGLMTTEPKIKISSLDNRLKSKPFHSKLSYFECFSCSV